MGIHSLDIMLYMGVKDRRRFAVYFCFSRKVRRRSYCIRPVTDVERENVEERCTIKKLKIRKGRRNKSEGGVGVGMECVNMKKSNICQFVVCLMTLTVS